MSASMGPPAVAPPQCLKPYTKFGFSQTGLGAGPSPFLLKFTRKRALTPKIRSSYDNPYCLDDNMHTSRYKSGFPSTKMDFLSPKMLGIYPDPPDWPERQEINRVRVERAASRTDIPMSLRIIKKKQQLQMGATEASGSATCSAVKTAFSSIMYIIRELQISALQLTENRGYDDLKEILNRVQTDMTESFVWLFRQVFAQTPTLMVYTMLLLANFSLYSMTGIPAIGAPVMTHTYHEEDRIGSDILLSRRLSRFSLSDNELTIGEAIVWNSVMEDVEEMRGEFVDEAVMRELIAPVVVQPEVDESLHEEYERMDVLYQVSLAQDPTNTLLLCNYAQFLCHVTRNYNWAEELFKLAIQSDPPDADAFCKYADFLCTVRKDAWAAEERYQQAIVEDPNNPHYAAKYANFLWSTGGDETCFPLDAPEEWYSNPELSKSDELP